MRSASSPFGSLQQLRRLLRIAFQWALLTRNLTVWGALTPLLQRIRSLETSFWLWTTSEITNVHRSVLVLQQRSKWQRTTEKNTQYYSNQPLGFLYLLSPSLLRDEMALVLPKGAVSPWNASRQRATCAWPASLPVGSEFFARKLEKSQSKNHEALKSNINRGPKTGVLAGALKIVLSFAVI